MYKLIFLKNQSKYFQEALDFALELGGSYDGNEVVVEIPEEKILDAYATMRTIFSFIQKWGGTRAEYNGNEAHPYQFIYHAHRIRECAAETIMDKTNCNLADGTEAWGCKKLDIISYTQEGNGIYKSNKKHWYNFGKFQGEKWVIDKLAIRERLFDQADKKALHLCPFFDAGKLMKSIYDLPDFIIPDDKAYKVHYVEKYINGTLVQVPNNIRHISYRVYSNFAFVKKV